MSRWTRLPLAVAVAASLGATTSMAQQLEEVLVTAQKRAENLQDVPISVSAIQGDQIQDAAIPNMTALADFVPNLYVATAAVNTNIYMRGVGSGNNQAFEQSVGMYIDGVYMGRGRQYRAGFMDIERIEVLRGPQGTLFGRNTVAGAVNISTASAAAGDDTSAQINVSMEQNDGEIVEGFVSSGLSDTFGARVAFRYRENEGYMQNTYLDRPEGGVEEQGYRISLNWLAADNIEIDFKYSQFEQERTGANSATNLYLTPAERDAIVPNRSDFANTAYAITDIFFPQLATEARRDFVTFKDNNFGNSADDGVGISFMPDGSEDELENMMLSLNWEIGDYMLTGITGYSGYTYVDDVDVDWLPLQFIARFDDQSFDQFSQELRLTSPGGEFFDWTVGAYYDDSTLEFDRRVTIDTNFDGLFPEFLSLVTPGNPPPSVLPSNLLIPLTAANPASALLGVYGADQIARNHRYELDTESWALFAQGTFNLSEVLRLTVGVRYTEESKDVVSSQRLGDSNCGLDGVADTSLPGCAGGYNYWLSLIQAANFNTYNYDFVDDRTTDQWVPSINLQWDASANTMLYASFSQGFKSGGFTSADDGEPGGYIVGQAPPPGAIFTTPNANFEFDDETVDAYEIGGKHDLLDGALRINWAAFYTEYDNLQTSIFNGLGFGVTNASSSEIQGIEVESQWQATDELRFGLNVSYLDATYADFRDGPCTAPQLDADPLCGTPAGSSINDLSGQPTTFASDWTGSLLFDYERPVGSYEVFASGEVNYRSEFQTGGDNDPEDLVDAFTKANLRIGMRTEHIELMLYGRNIFDEVAFVQGFDTPVLAGSHSYFVDEGRVFGVRLRYTY